MTLDDIDIISNERFGERGYPHDEWALLRREAPVWWNDRHVTHPFWAVTRHEDIVSISRQPLRFRNGPRLAVFPKFGPPPEGQEPYRHLLHMDPPEHATFRKLISHRFTPRGLERMANEIGAITSHLLDDMMGVGDERSGDLVDLLSAPLPLHVLAELIGVPREMWETMYQWTNETVGGADPDYGVAGERPAETAERARRSLFAYFAELAERRRADPRDDIATLLSAAEIGGTPLGEFSMLSYFFVLVVAGNETTRNAITGGVLALIENPEEWQKLRDDPALIPSAVEEIVRWTSPVIQFCRTPVEDVELRGVRIRAGENLCLFYPSANRDEDVFEAPFEFRVDRRPNRHLGFGIGEHFCLGANLARLELRVVLRQLVERLEWAELTGSPERLNSSLLGGIKRLPIRYRMGSGRSGRKTTSPSARLEE